MSDVLVVGAGVFGATAAWELQQRGHRVRLLDAGSVPWFRSATSDISKMVRTDYGADEFYTRLSEDCFPRWRDWNKSQGFFHETGILLLTPHEMAPGQFEHDSYVIARQRGYQVARFSDGDTASRFPLWSKDAFPDGYYIRHGGWAESGRVLGWITAQARGAGVDVISQAPVASVLEHAATGQVRGVRLEDGSELRADTVVVAAGAATPRILPHLAGTLTPCAQPVFFFQPKDRSVFQPDAGFPAYAAGLAATGFYGFPVIGNLLKVGHHGTGLGLRHDAPDAYVAPRGIEAGARAFVRRAWPSIAPDDLPFVGTRVCYYCDSFDGDFIIGRDPARPGLVVASGGSGHGFKFAPILGSLIADATEARPHAALSRFAYRTRGTSAAAAVTEGARSTTTLMPPSKL